MLALLFHYHIYTASLAQRPFSKPLGHCLFITVAATNQQILIGSIMSLICTVPAVQRNTHQKPATHCIYNLWRLLKFQSKENHLVMIICLGGFVGTCTR